MADSSEIFQRVRDAVDIVEIIGEHVALKRAGREFKGLCPFHDDHRPSMSVVPHKQIFVCFVCGTAGDVFKFVREYHKMSAGEALRMLAQRGGVQLPELSGRRMGSGQHGPSEREQIAETNEWACDFFQKHLKSPGGKAGLDYLHSRGLTDETIDRFRLGMAPDGWTGLVNAAMRLQIGMEKLDQAGLIKKRQDGSAYDVFRGRVMFPIIDATGGAKGGRVIGFGGRILEEKRDDQGNVIEAKYLNTPETRLFNKSESAYGLNLARQQVVRTRTAVVVEGYMDVIACNQVGVTNVIATLGTALTPQHARVLKNYAQTITLIFDSDDAGYRAADRAMEVLVPNPLDVKIASVPDGKDPCDFCMKNGGEAFQKIVDEAVDAMNYKWNRLRERYVATDSPSAREEAVTEFLRYAGASMSANIDRVDPIRRGQLIVKLSRIVGLPVDDVTELLFRFSRFDGVKTGASKRAALTGASLDRLRDAQQWLIGFILHIPELYSVVEERINVNLFPHEYLKAGLLIEYFDNTLPEERTLAGYCSFVSDQEARDEILHAAIAWERMAARWVEMPHLSAESAKLIRYIRQDLDHTPEVVVRQCLDFLIDFKWQRDETFKRGTFQQPTEEEELQELSEIVQRARIGKNRNTVGYVRNTPSQDTGFADFHKDAKPALRATG